MFPTLGNIKKVLSMHKSTVPHIPLKEFDEEYATLTEDERKTNNGIDKESKLLVEEPVEDKKDCCNKYFTIVFFGVMGVLVWYSLKLILFYLVCIVATHPPHNFCGGLPVHSNYKSNPVSVAYDIIPKPTEKKENTLQTSTKNQPSKDHCLECRECRECPECPECHSHKMNCGGDKHTKWLRVGSHCFTVHPHHGSLNGNIQSCKAIGGQLVSFTEYDVYNAVRHWFAKEAYRTGLMCATTYPYVKWVDGTPFTHPFSKPDFREIRDHNFHCTIVVENRALVIHDQHELYKPMCQKPALPSIQP
ncbi:putative C-type mannose receptor-2 [Bufonid herpesvirus 1]|uniref:putative C-type mannose receptor-2 n=1 Tax=Bufonid herpesvirus 1 TaxID=2282206 RepID=UPI000EB7607A|nr:putative C-type mannose receptor-2 [Bufonid herpesvirus 1]AXF48504.1 putative C-type mannose receptor-2 [Bufonid herpesvirus 1]